MLNTETPLLTRSYHIPLAMYDDAFVRFQKKFVYPTNIIMTIVLLGIAGVYVHAALKDPSQTLAYLLVVVCLALILVRWYRTFKLRRAVHDALKDVETDLYEMKLCKDGIIIRTEDAPDPKPQAAEEIQPEPEQLSEDQDGSGFHQIFPDTPAEPEEPIAPTEILFGNNVKILDYPEYFMVYILKQNFYVIPKKDFSESEQKQMKELFGSL